eukprot:GSMAST32.ASY1.ANO1.2672.1 assembled CDS
MCQWRDGTWRHAEIVEKHLLEGKKPEKGNEDVCFKYYVHYIQFNRRLDEWLDYPRIRLYKSSTKKKNKKDKTKEGTGTGDTADAKRKTGTGITGMDDASIREHELVTKVKNVNVLQLGRHRMETWYFSPYPSDIFGGSSYIEVLYLCEFCLTWFTDHNQFRRHTSKCTHKHPPGDEIYRHNKEDERSGGSNISMFELDGEKSTQYCQNLCYLAKLFLDHKTLYYDVQPFLFYVMCERTEYGYHPVGFYSKEKYSETGFNLACILAFPCYQRRGFGRFLIQFSYELSKKEGRVGSPEKPLSDLGLLSYRSFWSYEICMRKSNKSSDVTMSIMDIAKVTSIKTDDVVTTMQWLGLIRYVYKNNTICHLTFCSNSRRILQDLPTRTLNIYFYIATIIITTNSFSTLICVGG